MSVQERFWDYFWLAKFFFRAAGIIPVGGTPSLMKSALTKFLSIFPLMHSLYLMIPEINYILFRRHTTDHLLNAFTVVIGLSGLQLRSIVVAFHRQKIERLFVICESLWDNTILADRKVTSVWAKQARLFSTAYFCAAQFSIITFVSTGIIKQLSRPENSTIGYYPYRYPDDVAQSPEYEIRYMMHVIIGSLGHWFMVAADMTGTLLALNMSGQFALIRSWLMEISKKDSIATEENIKCSERTLEKCVRRHQVVLEFCAELEEVTHHINLAQMIPGMYVLAISGAQMVESLRSSRHFGPLMFTICGLFFSCWPADRLSTTSTEVAAAVYGVPWYDYSSRGRTTVAIMLVRSQRPVELTAGKFVALSLETFSSIVSTSASYLMVLYRFSRIE